VFDPVGGAALFEALKAVAWGAQYLVIGFASGDIPKVGLRGGGTGAGTWGRANRDPACGGRSQTPARDGAAAAVLRIYFQMFMNVLRCDGDPESDEAVRPRGSMIMRAVRQAGARSF
jgi:hypothetical protein